MKKDNKKALYESIMTAVAKEVKKVLNEGEYNNYEDNYEESKTLSIKIKNMISKINEKLDELASKGVTAISFRKIRVDNDTKLDTIITEDHMCLTADTDTDEWNNSDIDLDELLDEELEYRDINELYNIYTLILKILNIINMHKYKESYE